MFIKDMCGLMWKYFTNIWNFQEAKVGVWGVGCEGEAAWEGEVGRGRTFQKPYGETARDVGMS